MPDSLTVLELRKLAQAIRAQLDRADLDKQERLAILASVGKIGDALARIHRRYKPRGNTKPKAKRETVKSSTDLSELMKG